MTLPDHLTRPALLLGSFALLGLGLVAFVHDGTAERIAANERAVLLATLEELVPAERFDNDLLADTRTLRDTGLAPGEPVTVYRARKAGRPVAAVLPAVAPDGYGGAIRLLVAIGVDGRLLGVRVLSHRETPGLGDGIDTARSGWIRGFAGRALDDPPLERWAVRKDGGDFDQFAGATITPRAVVGAVRRSLVFFRDNRRDLFDAPAE